MLVLTWIPEVLAAFATTMILLPVYVVFADFSIHDSSLDWKVTGTVAVAVADLTCFLCLILRSTFQSRVGGI